MINVTDDILVKYFTNEAETHEVSMIMEWRNANSDNEAKFLQVKKIWENSAHSHSNMVVDEDLAWQKVQSKLNNSPKGKVVLFNAKWLVAASIIFIMGLGAFMYNSVIQNSKSELFSLSAKQGRQNTTLSDGTKVSLKNGTLVYQVKFEGSKRQVKLDNGVAYFDVAKNKEMPFEIAAGNTFITVVGTQFEVTSNTEFIQVLVEEGKVIFKTPVGEKILTQGMGAKYTIRTQQLEDNNAFTNNAFAYTLGVLNFNNESLENVVADLNTYQSDYKVIIENKILNNCKITTVFEKAKLDDILLVISTTLNLSIDRDEKSKTIILKGNKCN